MSPTPAESTTPSPISMPVPAATAAPHITALAWAYLPIFDFLEQSSLESVLHVFKYAGAALLIGLVLAYLAHARGMRKLIHPAKMVWLVGFCLLLGGGFMAVPRAGRFFLLVLALAFAVPLLLILGWVYVWGDPTGPSANVSAETVPLTERPEGENEANKRDDKQTLPV